jgi:hypothetical protein
MYNGKFYAIKDLGALFEIDIAEPTKVTMVAMPHSRPPERNCFLVD